MSSPASCRRTQKRHVHAVPPGDRGDLLIVRADHDPRQRAADTRGVGRVREQRTTRERREVLARNAFRTAARRNDTEDVQVLNPLLDVHAARDSTSAIRSPARPSPYK